MIRPDYKSFESTDLYVSPYLADEANALLSSNANKANDASSRDKRRRTVSVVAIVIALVALTFLISFNSGSNTKFTSARGSSSSDMHSFETIATGTMVRHRFT